MMRIPSLEIFRKLLFFKVKIEVLLRDLYSKFAKKPLIMDTDETIRKLQTSDCSMSRFGDGEFEILRGIGIGFQKFDVRLQGKLQEILLSENCNYITCIPYTVISTKGLKKEAEKFWKNYFSFHAFSIYKFINRKNKIYYDSLVTRLYIDFEDHSKARQHFQKIKFLWQDKDILIVEGEKSRLGVGNDFFGNVKSIHRIIGPSIDAFNSYDVLLNAVYKHARKETLILFALGPTATVMSYELCLKGYRALDIGHIDVEYEWFLMKAKEKVPLPYKFVGDILSEGDKSYFFNKEYEQSILERV